MNLKLVLSYDGTCFYGWQKTASGPSIEEELERSLVRVLGYVPSLYAASRTDRGVHAKGQVVHFLLRKALSLPRLLASLRGVVPPSISIQSLECVDPGFHATLNAKGKEYCYFLCNAFVQLPSDRLYSWHFYKPLDLEAMKKSSVHLLGTHNFSAFANERETNPVCTLFGIELVSLPQNRLSIVIRGNRFLYKMVRNLVGTLVYVGCQKLREDLSWLLKSEDRKLTGVTAPAHGLFLNRVFYH